VDGETMEFKYKINFVTDDEPFDPSTIEEHYGWYQSNGKDEHESITNLVEIVQREHSGCNVLVLGDFIETRDGYEVIGYAARTKQSPEFSADQTQVDHDFIATSE
jgi:hypothetical protein